ncbi:MAG TPA: hypothetical protein VE983_07405 [Solirubrobacteraceae bacterium]|nr:hypothetical protein [Solirubrobacteraceae bacterium]
MSARPPGHVRPGRTPAPDPARRWRRLSALAALLLAALAVVAVALNAGAGTKRRSNSGQATEAASTQTRASHPASPSTATNRPGPRITGVGKFNLALSEPSPSSIATGQSAAGQPVRALPTVVRYPVLSPRVSGLRFPLVVFSQGFDEPAEAYAGLLNAWARAGYVVASPTYPLTDPSSPGGVNESDIVNHPADLRFVISALQAGAGDPHSRLYGVLNPREVAVVGQSDGGDVSLAVAANSCCQDNAVKAAMILSGAELSAFGGTYYSPQASGVPLLVVQGSDDTINLPGCSVQLYDQAPPPKYYLAMSGAQHLPPYIEPGPTRRGIELATIAFLNSFLKHRPAALVRARSHLPVGETLTSGSAAPGPTGQACPGAP